MHIVITRPKEDSYHLIGKLINLGHVATHLPVIKVEKLKTKKINLQDYKAIIFTSSNAIKYMNIEKFDFKIKCFCVGKTTEFAANSVALPTQKHLIFKSNFSIFINLAALELVNITAL